MNRKLLLLDFVLVVLVVYAGVHLRNQWRAAKARETATLKRRVPPSKPPAFAPLEPAPPVMATAYNNIAQKMLFDKSRDPTVVIEVAPPPPKPPMPPLPVFHGVMNLGDGPIAILSASKDSAHEAVKPGETIGAFKLVAVNSQEMTLEWQGETVTKPVSELTLHTEPAPQPQAQAQAAPSAVPPPPDPAQKGPGEMTQFGFKMCKVDDGHAEGEVVDGFRKVLHHGPFGTNCTYDPVGK